MTMPKYPKRIASYREKVARIVRMQRVALRWTQAELAERLDLSQSRLSEIELGRGSFTAEQFLVLLESFNLPASAFALRRSPPADLQNALARAGARSLLVVDDIPVELDREQTVAAALGSGVPRNILGASAVLLANPELDLLEIQRDLASRGLERRLPWLVENTSAALETLIAEPGTGGRAWLKRHYVVGARLETFIHQTPIPGNVRPDVVDTSIIGSRARAEARERSSPISRRWGIVSDLQSQDFVDALTANHDADR